MSAVSHLTKEQVVEEATTRGLHAVFPCPEELLLDLDSNVVNIAALRVLQEAELVKSVFSTTSANGRSHLYVRLSHKIVEAERLALQAILGSDPLREALGFVHMQNGRIPTVLFETTKALEKVQQRREKRNQLTPMLTDDDIPF